MIMLTDSMVFFFDPFPNTTEETVNVNETNPVPVEETEPAENTKK
jgi:hypothetical protein